MARRDRELDMFEEQLVEAWIDLHCSPDRDRAFLAAGSRSCMPQVLRNPVTDYPGDDAPRRPPASRQDVARYQALFVVEGCVSSLVPADRKPLVRAVLDLKAWPARKPFLWQTVWERLGVRGRAGAVSKDALRTRYETQLGRMLGAWRVRQGGGGLRAAFVVTDELAGSELLAELADATVQVRESRIAVAAGRIGQGEVDAALARLEAARAALVA